MGFASLWVLERLLAPVAPVAGRAFPPGYRSVFDPIESLTFAAAKTSRIKLGTSVMDVLFHSPVMLGKRLATLDQLSGGRLVAGLGQGHMQEEFKTSNVPMSRRGPGFEEFISALRAVWGPDPVAFKGRFYEVPESYVGPKPVQAGGPKILIGAFVPAAIERAGRIGDGFNPVASELEVLKNSVETFRNSARTAGRDPSQLPVVIRANAQLSKEATPDTRFLSGPLNKISEDLQGLKELEPDEVFLDFGSSPESIKDQLRAMEQLIKAIE